MNNYKYLIIFVQKIGSLTANSIFSFIRQATPNPQAWRRACTLFQTHKAQGEPTLYPQTHKDVLYYRYRRASTLKAGGWLVAQSGGGGGGGGLAALYQNLHAAWLALVETKSNTGF